MRLLMHIMVGEATGLEASQQAKSPIWAHHCLGKMIVGKNGTRCGA